MAIIFLSSIAAQCVQGDCYNGNGTFVFKSGAKYSGKFRNGKIYNFGTLYFRDGSIYTGQWKNQRREGAGKITYPNGSIYVGEFDNNKRSGKGKLVLASGKSYTGTWTNDIYDGKKPTNGNHVVLASEQEPKIRPNKQNTNSQYFKDCNQAYCGNSDGRYTYLDGSYYEGDFRNGAPEGQGICYYKSGDRYEGGWKNNAPEGKGIMFFKSGVVYAAIWNAGYPTKKIETNPNQINKQRTRTQNIVEESDEVKIWAVIVGIASYNHMPTLKYTDDDAYQIYAFLKSPEGGALPDERISLLIDEAATRERILNEMDKTFSKADENDVIMLYYSGHGLPGSFLPIDFDGYNNLLQHQEIKQILDRSEAKHKIVFADACHSGSLLALKSPFNATRMESFFEGFEKTTGGTALFTSSKSEEISLETSGLRQGIYSHFLIRGLRGEADRNSDKLVTISELFSYVNRNVRSYSKNRQTPVIAGNYDENMPVAMVR